MKKIDFAETFKVAGVLFLICVLVTALLSGTYIVTKDPIAKAAAEAEAASRIKVLPADEYFPIEGYDNAFLAVSQDKAVGAVIVTRAKGYGGDITVMTGILASGEVSGVTILDLSETPGVGMKTDDPAHLSQYVTADTVSGTDVSATDAPTADDAVRAAVISFTLGKDEGDIHAITGATISSTAVNNAVNEALRVYNELVGGGLLTYAPQADASPSDAQ